MSNPTTMPDVPAAVPAFKADEPETSPREPGRKPMMHGDLFEAAVSLLLCADSPFVEVREEQWVVEETLQRARIAAADYFIAACAYGATAYPADHDDDEDFTESGE